MLNAFVRLSLLICCLDFYAPAHAQRSAIEARFRSLESLQARADTLRPFDQRVENIYDTIAQVNSAIDSVLTAQLQDPALKEQDRLRLLRLFQGVRSADGRLLLFDWYENTGGSWKSYQSVLHYRSGNGARHSLSSSSDPDSHPHSEVFNGQGASFDKIYKLRAPGRDLYLCIGSGVSCNTCLYQMAIVVELTQSGARFDYPAFRSNDETAKTWHPEFLIESRMGNMHRFDFDPRTQTLIISYTTDDNTPVHANSPRRISRRLKFDGRRFNGNGYQ
jgi:hypothetical protein